MHFYLQYLFQFYLLPKSPVFLLNHINKIKQRLVCKQKKKKLVDFLDINKNHEFKNITPVFHFFANIKKLCLHVIKVLVGFFSTVFLYFSYSNFVYSIDGFLGTREKVLHQVEFLRNSIQNQIQKAQCISDIEQESFFLILKQHKLDRIQKLNDRLFFLEKLSEKNSPWFEKISTK
jgi:hypothetical protein